jgi:hypothetical protein
VIERPASGMGKETVLYRSTGSYFPQSWSDDGRWLVLMAVQFSGAFHLLPMGAEESGGERKLIPLPESPAEGRNPSISPDGRWLLYSSTQTGSREVFLENLPEAPRGRRKKAGLDRRRHPARLAGRRQGGLLLGSGRQNDGRVGGIGCRQFQAWQTDTAVPNPTGFGCGSSAVRCLRGRPAVPAGAPLEGSASVPITVIVNWPALVKKCASRPERYEAVPNPGA